MDPVGLSCSFAINVTSCPAVLFTQSAPALRTRLTRARTRQSFRFVGSRPLFGSQSSILKMDPVGLSCSFAINVTSCPAVLFTQSAPALRTRLTRARTRQSFRFVGSRPLFGSQSSILKMDPVGLEPTTN